MAHYVNEHFLGTIVCVSWYELHFIYFHICLAAKFCPNKSTFISTVRVTKPVYLLVQVFFEVTPQLNCYTYTLKQFLDFPSYAVVLFVVFVYYVVGYVNDGLMSSHGYGLAQEDNCHKTL